MIKTYSLENMYNYSRKKLTKKTIKKLNAPYVAYVNYRIEIYQIIFIADKIQRLTERHHASVIITNLIGNFLIKGEYIYIYIRHLKIYLYILQLKN